MILQFSRLGIELEIGTGSVCTLQIEGRSVFARVVESLVSEQGEEAEEPYVLWSDIGKVVSPRKAFLVLNHLPEAPLDDRVLMGKVCEQIADLVEQDKGKNDSFLESWGKAIECLNDVNVKMWGSYDLSISWDLVQFLKAFALRPRDMHSAPLIEKCIAFFELCVDAKIEKPIILVNAKSFFTENEFQMLIDQAIFCNVSLLCLESWPDAHRYESENKIVLDQDLLVHS